MRKHCWLPLLILCVGARALWTLRSSLTAAHIAAHSPEQTWLATAFLLVLYAIKGLSMTFPLVALEAAGGLLFPFPAALAINFCGVLLAQTLPFFLGRREQTALTALTARHPRLAAVRPGPHPFRTVLLLRLAGAAPGDLVSLYLGAAGVPFLSYLAGGALGSLPRIAAATVLGTALLEIGSTRFWLSVLPGAALTGLSLLLWKIWR